MSKVVLQIPHPSLLRFRSIKEWISYFEQMAGRSVTDIVLPAVGFFGPYFTSEIRNTRDELKLIDWIEDARTVSPNIFVWGSVDCNFAFLAINSLVEVRDQFSSTLSDRACVTNSITQELANIVVEEMTNLVPGVDGIVLDITDVYPQSAGSTFASGPLGLQHTCFCSYCLEALAQEGYREGASPFSGLRNPFRVVLRQDDDGIANIPVNLPVYTSRPDILLERSVSRKFLEEGDQNAQEDLRHLLSYLSARAIVVAKSVRKLTQKAKQVNESKRVAIMLSSPNIDLTTMTDLASLASQESADEYWCPEAQDGLSTEGIYALQYLFVGGSYSIAPCFRWMDDAWDLVQRTGLDAYIKLFRSRYRKIRLGNELSTASILVNERSKYFQGFVGIPIKREIVDELEGFLIDSIVNMVHK